MPPVPRLGVPPLPVPDGPPEPRPPGGTARAARRKSEIQHTPLVPRLLRVLLGPLRLIYIPHKLFVHGNAAATASNIAAHEWLFRFGMLCDLLGAVILIFLMLAFYRLFKRVEQQLAVLLVIVGGVMPALINFVNVVSDAGALMVARGGVPAAPTSYPSSTSRGVMHWSCCSSACITIRSLLPRSCGGYGSSRWGPWRTNRVSCRDSLACG